jgi:hypothetical protein
MNKLDYLRKVFAHTKGKTFENYVINQIWAKVEELGIISGYSTICKTAKWICFA